MRFQHRLVTAVFVMAAALGCRKDKDSEPPTVRILSPGAGFSVGVPDTFTVVAEVSDDRIVKSLTILLAAADGVPITASVVIPVNAPSRQISVGFSISDERIVSGQYVLTAVAEDGSNTSRDFITITVQAAPLRVRATFLAPPATQTPPYSITKVDSAGAMSAFAVLGELGGVAIDRDHLYTTGTGTEPLRLWRISTGSFQLLLSNPSVNPNYFKCLKRDPRDDRLYACTADGQLRGYASDGGQTFYGTTPDGFIGEATAVVGDFLMCLAVNPVTQQRVLVKHGYVSGARLAEFSASVAPVAMFERGSQQMLLFGNTASGGHILEVNTALGGSFEMREFTGEPIRCVERLSPDQFVLGFADGIRRFDRSTNTVVTIVPGIATDGLTYEPVSGTVAAASGNQVVVINPISGTVATTLAAPHPVGKVLYQLNR